MRCKNAILTTLLLLAALSAQAQFPCFSGTTVNANVGGDDIDLCLDVSTPVITFGTNINALPFGYIVVDESGTIVYISTENTIDFSQLPGGNLQVYAFNFIGNISASVGDPFNGTPLADGCFAITSNSISISGDAISGGMVSTEDGAAEAFTCPGDGLPDLIPFDSSGVGPGLSYTYVVTDENNIILDVPDGDVVDFENAGTGTCRLWGLAYTGNLTAMAGDNAADVQLADNCFALSSNFVTVYREEPDGGMVMTEDGATELSFCIGSGEGLIAFDSMDVSNSNFTYVVTDEDNVILEVPSGDVVDFENSPAGVCRVWGLAYTGNLTAMVGDTASAVDLTDACFDLSDNFVTVTREEADGGTISTEDGDTEIFVCVGDGEDDFFRFDSIDVSGPNFTYVVTDENNVILSVTSGDEVNFEDGDAEIIRVWGLAYSGSITAMVGDTASAVALSDGCFDLSDNFVTVNGGEPDGGTVSTEGGETEVFTCPGDGVADVIQFDSMDVSGPNFTYVITDDNNVILGVPSSDMNDFEDAGTGSCRVWGLAYTGTITAMAGDTASAVPLTDGCFDLSDNFITVYREQPDGGMVMTEGGETEVFTCPGDSIPDVISFDSTGVSNSNFTYVITDDNNVILGVPGSDSNDFEDAGAGTCRVWGLAYTGNITAMAGDTASVVALTDDCFDLSDNFITVFREQPDGGTVSTEMGMDTVEVCVGDGIPDIVRFDSAGVSGQFTYVITDENNVILELPGMDMADFEDADGGLCRVWGLAYTGNIIAMAGDTASAVDLSDGCFDLSDNFIIVNRNEVDGGTVSTEDDENVVYVCTSDTLADIIVVDSSGTAGPNFTYVVTDENNVILDLPGSDTIDLSAAPAGICRIWGLSYTGNVMAMVGDTASAVNLTDGCFGLSDNFVTAFRDEPEGGTVATEAGADTVTACVGDGLSDFIPFDSSGTSLSNFTYVITDTNNIFIGVFDGDEFDFENASIDAFRVWGLSYTGSLLAFPGDNAATATLTDECFDLSDNFVTVLLDRIEGGALEFIIPTEAEGEDIAYICPQPGQGQVLVFNTIAPEDNYNILLTDTNNVVLNVQSGNEAIYDFANATEEEQFRIYGVAYADTALFSLNDTLTEDLLQGPCYTFAEDFLTVIVDTPDGGTVTTEGGLTEVDVVVNDGEPDVVRFDSIGTSNSSYIYIITLDDIVNSIIDIVEDGDTFDFESLSGDNSYRVWGLAYTGNLLNAQNAQGNLSTGCFSLSENFVTVNATTGFAPGGNSTQLRSWPNPASDQLAVYIDASFERASGETAILEIISLTGNILETRRIDTQTQTVNLDLNRLNAGTYWVRYRSSRAVQTLQFVKD